VQASVDSGSQQKEVDEAYERHDKEDQQLQQKIIRPGCDDIHMSNLCLGSFAAS
jgi:hypothetical protein